jgi:miniconductance mechanosensitive channel
MANPTWLQDASAAGDSRTSEVLRGIPKALESWLGELGLSTGAGEVASLSLLAALILVAWLVHLFTRRFIVGLLERFVRRTEAEWDNLLIDVGFFGHLAHLLPTLIVYLGAPVLLYGSPTWEGLAQKAALVYLVFLTASMASDLLTVGLRSYERSSAEAGKRSIKSYVQVARLIVWLFAAIVIVGVAIDRSPWALLTGLGAMTAVLMLVFKDSILGLVASVQIAGNDMVRIGDWIEMPSHGADGDVIEINLTTVKVRNWNKTITTVPTYALVSNAFKNWRGMSESDGRRIKRSLYLDVSSIRMATEEDLDRWSRIALLAPYLEERRKAVAEHNQGLSADLEIPVNGRRLTNVGTFRAYVAAYLEAHPGINQEMTLLVRQLPPTERGLPIELYCFSSDKRWSHYEDLQSDLFDHLFAVLDQFGLKAFQGPTGEDVRALRQVEVMEQSAERAMEQASAE